jgi:hypothetical protein
MQSMMRMLEAELRAAGETRRIVREFYTAA